ncbi:division abnormally delayed protein [Sipha flava]|uniref:Division abnormally delayed protein n=2 Tax=Sipha flava TaxID=143950 RepID=A0A8B8FU13_9HEMI|nr:division abnormally delayed protein [Sipha flava]
MRRFLLAVIALSAHRLRDGCTAYPSSSSSADCDVAVQRFRSVGLYDTPSSRIDQGNNLKVCQSQQSCCNAATEVQLIDMVDNEYKRHLAGQASFVYDLLNSTAHHLQDHMTHMIRKSKSKTIRVLADVYVSIEGPATSLLDMFYGRLSRYVHEDPETTPASSLEDAASKLFSDLFPVVYRTVAVAFDKLDNSSQFDEDYVQCLVGKSFEIRPFGDVPYMLAKDISRTFTATNVLVHALRYGGQLVDAEHSRSWLGYGNRDQCVAALTRMKQCSWCDGKDSKPCHGLCVNVIRGCLARETAHLDAPWTGYYEAVDRLVSAINNGQSSVCLEDLLRSLHSRISEAIMYAMNHASDIQNNVKYYCGPAKWNNRAPLVTTETLKTPESQEVWNIEEEDLSSAKLTSKLFKFSDTETVVRVRGLFSNMAHSMCSNYTTTNCWNGRTVGEYTDNVVGPLLSAQMYNPEFDWTSSINTQDNKVAEVIDKLRHIRQMVLNQLTPSSQSDLFMADEAEGSGEGSGDGGVSKHAGWDDDDNVDEYSSGDGSGENPITTQLPGVADPKGHPTDISAPKSGSDIVINSKEPTGVASSLHVPLLIMVCLIPVTRIF